MREGPATPGPLADTKWWSYATATPLLCATTLPLVIFGAFGITVLKFSSVIHFETTFVDSPACSDVWKRPSELRTPLSASIEVVAGKPGELAKLRHERLVDLAGDLVHAGRVDAFVTTNGGMHVMLLTVVLQGRTLD